MHIHRGRWKTFAPSPKILVVAFLPVVVAIVLSGSVALAGSVEDRTTLDEKAKLELMSMGVDPGAAGEAELELRIEPGKREVHVTGATGNFGGAVIAGLIHMGAGVRALGRHETRAQGLKEPGVEVVVGDLKNTETSSAVFIRGPGDTPQP